MNLPSCLVCWSNILFRLRTGLVCLAAVFLAAGCRLETSPSTPAINNGSAAVNLDAELAQASTLGKPLVILVTQLGQSQADDEARALLDRYSEKLKRHGFVSLLLDLNVSRNRATATRFHVTNTPVLLCLSPNGLIVSRDETPITKALVSKRIGEIPRKATELDLKLGLLEQAASQNANDPQPEFELANFFLAQQNAREAIPCLEAVARNEAAATVLRIRAWTALARAHFWVGEPEKGRHEAVDLIAVLGSKTPEARSAGNYVLGIQDAAAKRPDRARQEFEIAISASPDSVYAKASADAIKQLAGAGR